VTYSDYQLKELAKDDHYLPYNKGCSYINIGVELQLPYKSDEEKRGPGNALKIFDSEAGGTTPK
jgi:hypothetical protein